MNIHQWNSVFVLIDGSFVCPRCMIAQPLVCLGEMPPHSPECKYDVEETQHPWVNRMRSSI